MNEQRKREVAVGEVLDELAEDCREFLQAKWEDEKKLETLLACIRHHIEEWETVR